ncbi:MAG: CBS domain-containing protein [Bacteroidota bacterium]
MTSQKTFYLSQIIGSRVKDVNGIVIGRLKDLVVDISLVPSGEEEPVRPRVVAALIRAYNKNVYISYSDLSLVKKRSYEFVCTSFLEMPIGKNDNYLQLATSVLDKQIVDLNGRKLVRVNDVRLVNVPGGVFAIAVDVGLEGLLRRIGISTISRWAFSVFRANVPSHYIIWDDVEAIETSNLSIRLSKTSSRLHKLHPSDIADIIEEMGRTSATKVFESLDEEQAADVLEEMEPHTQAQIIESLPIEKAADVLEKMPADEVADLLDTLNDDRAEQLLNEMEKESSEEVRELLEYSKSEVGSLMTTDYMLFTESMSVLETLEELRRQKPEPARIYSLFVADKDERFIATVSLRDLVVSEPSVTLKDIMEEDAISLFDDDKIDSLAEIISKYNLLAIPVTDKEMKMQGMVVIDDIIEDLLDRRKTK